MKEQELLLIGGYMHSGTTLLHNILISHPQILESYKETKILEWNAVWQAKYDNTINKLNFLNEKILHEDSLDYDFNSTTEDVVMDLFSLLRYKAQKKNCKYYLEGSPNNYLLLDKIPSDLNYKLFLITRDPRDIIASIKKRITSKNFGNASELKGRLSNHYSFILYVLSIRKSFKKMNMLIGKKNVFSTDYYELTNYYERTINRIASFLTVESEGFLNEDDITLKNTADINYKPNKALYFSSNFIKNLTKREISVIEYLFSDYFEDNPHLKISKKGFGKFWYVMYYLRLPYDLIIFFMVRLIRFGSFKRFISYFKTTLRRF